MNNDIQFNHVQFAYASRKNQPVFTDLNLRIEVGKVTGRYTLPFEFESSFYFIDQHNFLTHDPVFHKFDLTSLG